jgi:hypothetical protein
MNTEFEQIQTDAVDCGTKEIRTPISTQRLGGGGAATKD